MKEDNPARSETEGSDVAGAAEPLPFVAPCRDLDPRSPWLSLKGGWSDFREAPLISLSWGVFAWLLSTLIAWVAWAMGGWVLLLSLLLLGLILLVSLLLSKLLLVLIIRLLLCLLLVILLLCDVS